MIRRHFFLVAAVVAVGSFAPAVAGPKKPAPIKKSYTATTTMADPTPFIGETCDPMIAGAKHDIS